MVHVNNVEASPFTCLALEAADRRLSYQPVQGGEPLQQAQISGGKNHWGLLWGVVSLQTSTGF